MAKEIEEQLSAKPLRLFSKVTSCRTDKEMTGEKKYEGSDDDGKLILQNQDDINRTNANDRDERSILQNQDGINRANANDRDERSILQNQGGGQYQGQHTASSWAYHNQTCTMLLPDSVAYNFPSFSGLHQVFVPPNTCWVYYFPAM